MIEVTVKHKSLEPYPCIKKHINNGNIVLFIGRSKGVSLTETMELRLGEYCTSLIENNFTPFHGEIVIEQKG